MPWAELLLRVFREDLLACDRCGGRRVVLAYLSERSVVRLSAAPTPPQAPSLLCSGSWVSVAPRVEAAARAARSQEHSSQSPHLLRLRRAGVGEGGSNKRTLRAGQAERMPSLPAHAWQATRPLVARGQCDHAIVTALRSP